MLLDYIIFSNNSCLQLMSLNTSIIIKYFSKRTLTNELSSPALRTR